MSKSVVVRLWQILIKIMFQSSFGSLLNHPYHYANGNVSVRHLSLICITSILTVIYSLKICSVYGRSCRNYSPKSFGFFCKEFRRVLKNINILFTSLGRSVKGKTEPSVKTLGTVFPILTSRLENHDMCIVTSSTVFWRACMTSQNTNNDLKYSAILHSKTSNRICITQLLFFLLSISAHFS